jgi:hypothetical protein
MSLLFLFLSKSDLSTGSTTNCGAPASIVSFHFFSFPFSRAVLDGNQKPKLLKTALFFLKTSPGTSEIFQRKF